MFKFLVFGVIVWHNVGENSALPAEFLKSVEIKFGASNPEPAIEERLSQGSKYPGAVQIFFNIFHNQPECSNTKSVDDDEKPLVQTDIDDHDNDKSLSAFDDNNETLNNKDLDDHEEILEQEVLDEENNAHDDQYEILNKDLENYRDISEQQEDFVDDQEILERKDLDDDHKILEQKDFEEMTEQEILEQIARAWNLQESLEQKDLGDDQEIVSDRDLDDNQEILKEKDLDSHESLEQKDFDENQEMTEQEILALIAEARNDQEILEQKDLGDDQQRLERMLADENQEILEQKDLGDDQEIVNDRDLDDNQEILKEKDLDNHESLEQKDLDNHESLEQKNLDNHESLEQKNPDDLEENLEDLSQRMLNPWDRLDIDDILSQMDNKLGFYDSLYGNRKINFDDGVWEPITDNSRQRQSAEVVGKTLPKTIFRLYTEPLPWNEARKACHEEKGNLAVLRSNADEYELMDKMERADIEGAWIGVHNMYNDKEWVSVFDEPLEKTGWFRWSPLFELSSTVPNEKECHCGQLLVGGGLTDQYCDIPRPFVCSVPRRRHEQDYGEGSLSYIS